MSGYRILLVDNRQSTLESYSDKLQLDGYEVMKADSEDSALAILVEHLIHLVIVDVRLRSEWDENDKSGLEFCKMIDPIIPRIILTGYVGDWTTIRDALTPSRPEERRRRQK